MISQKKSWKQRREAPIIINYELLIIHYQATLFEQIENN
jgi:hypothetical protein